MKKILNPFISYSDKTLIILATVATLIGFLLAYFFNAIFDGAIDLHFVEKSNLMELINTMLVSIFSIIICLSLAAYFINPKTRFFDIIMVVLIARIPLYMLSLTNINSYQYLFSNKILEILPSIQSNPDVISDFLKNNIFALIANTLLSFSMLILFFLMLYNGFKTATNLKKSLHILFFIAAIIAAEVLSKTLIYLIIN